MKNCQYNLLKLFHNALDTVWRIEKHYSQDTDGDMPGYKELVEEIKNDNQKHVEKLTKMVGKACSE